MNFTKYKLKDICVKITDGSHYSPEACESGYPMFSVKDMGDYNFIYDDVKYISKSDFSLMLANDCVPQKDDVLIAKDGSYLTRVFVCEETKNEAILSSIAIFRCNKEIVNPKFLAYLFKTPYVKNYTTKSCVSGSALPRIVLKAFSQLELFIPSLEEQKKIVSILSPLDRKISLNRSINAELERMAKEVYDYWFVQFDFPDEHGRPYKSSGGAMVYNPVLKREVPEGWEVKSFADFVSKQNGDWGEENPTATNDIEVLCARGADIVQMEDLPHRYISKSHLDRLMKKGDIMVEISGGSPVQATGRYSYISEALLSRLGQKLVCSNFCQVVRVQDYEMSSYLYMTWDLLYKNDNMFKFEGKTSGIKNFQIDSFLQTKWSIPPHNLISKYQVLFDNLLSKKEALKKEIELLKSQRDELLPLLMTGQVEVI